MGPPTNPADIAPADDVIVAMQKIAVQNACSFLSRDDGSGSNERKRDLWCTAGARPWRAADGCPYVTENMLPRAALVEADRRGAHTLTDHGTWVSTRHQLRHSQPYGQPNARLIHPCPTLLQTQPSAAVQDLYQFLFSPTAWQVRSDSVLALDRVRATCQQLALSPRAFWVGCAGPAAVDVEEADAFDHLVAGRWRGLKHEVG